MTTAYCTLFEGDYHLGAAALLNSLWARGHRGTVVVGYRGPEPAWFDTARRLWGEGFQARALPTAPHFAWYKADFLDACLDELPSISAIAYLDPDVVVHAPVALLDRWMADGIALVGDVNSDLPARHPYRLRWMDALASAGHHSIRSRDTYVNSGFVGVPRALRHFLPEWREMLGLVQRALGSASGLKSGGPNDLFHSTDQDALNMALMTCDVPVNEAGPDAMGFRGGGHILVHGVGTPKPWHASGWRAVVAGRPPSLARRAYLDHAGGPLRAVGPRSLWLARRGERVASAVGRVYSR